MWKIEMKHCFSLFMLSCSTSLLALPSGGEVVSGRVQITPYTDTLEVQAQSPAIINWDQFDIASHEAVSFTQTHAKNAILNRVIGGTASELLGNLHANCPIYLINGKGIFIGTSAHINTGGFLASTADISNEVFLQGNTLLFEQLGEGKIVNLGTITCPQGDLFLIARSIDNQGAIEAPSGVVSLATSEVMIDPKTKQAIFIRLCPEANEEGIDNSGTIQALVIELKTQSPYAKAINHTGSIQALSTIEQNGKVYLIADNGGSVVDGVIIAQSGNVHVLGQQVQLDSNTHIDVSGDTGGSILIGGDYQGANPDILNAQNTSVAPGAQLQADGYLQDGGKIIVWSDGTTHFEGHISAQALGSTGNGGFAEISGLIGLRVDDHPNLQSRRGKDGTLLLDPGSVLIQDGANVAPPISLDVFNDAWIAAQLALGSVSIATTDSTNAAAETLTVNGNVNITWATANNLTLTATRNVVINSGAVISCTNAGSLSITGQGGIAGVTYIGLSIAGGALSTTTGNLTLSGTGGDTGATNVGMLISGAPTISTTSGTLAITGNGGLASNGITKTGGTVTTSGNGPLNMTGIAGAGGTGVGISLTGGTVSTTNNGPISLTGTGAGTGSGSNGLNISTNITAGGTGALTINGTASSSAASSYGISITGGTSSTNSGLFTLIAQGGGAGDSNRGISVTSGTITTTNGNMLINALGTNGPGSSCVGIYPTGGSIGPQGIGTLTINNAVGSSGVGAGANNYGISFINGGSITTVTGNIDITALGATQATGNGNRGISMDGVFNAMRIESTSGGSITMNATGSPLGGNTNYGIYLWNDGPTSGEFRRIQTAGAIDITAIGTGSTGGGSNVGIALVNTGTINSSGSTVNIQATGGGIGNNCIGIVLSNQETAISSIDNMTIMAQGSPDSTAGGGHYGISFINGGSITTVTGNIDITALGATQATGNSNRGISMDGVFNAMSIESTSGGLITINATGSPVGGNTNYGIYLWNDGPTSGEFRRIQTAGAIDITAIGTGSTGGGSNVGIALVNTGTINSSGSTVNIQATGGGIGSNCIGIVLSNQETAISSIENITITAQGSPDSTSGGGHYGIGFFDGGSITTVTGNIDITAFGATLATGNGNRGISMDGTLGSMRIESTSGGLITINAIGSPVGGNTNYGIYLWNDGPTSGEFRRIQTAGAINITAIGTGSTGGGSNVGIALVNTGTINSSGSTVNIQATGGGIGSNCIGIVLSNQETAISSIENITITAQGSPDSTSGGGHYGIGFFDGGSITTVTGNIDITAFGATLATGNGNRGISMDGVFNAMSIESTSGGSITMNATGSPVGGNTNYGIYLWNDNAVASEFRRIQTVGAIDITAIGTGSTGGSGNVGVLVTNVGTIRSTGVTAISTVTVAASSGGGQGCQLTGLGEISSVGGNLSVVATSSSTAGAANQGLLMNSASSLISSVDGIVNVTGLGGLSSPGIQVSSGQIRTTGTGNIICNGTGGSSGAGAQGMLLTGASSLVQTTNGSISLTGTGNGTGSNASGIQVQSAAKVLAGNAGNITLDGIASLTGTTGNSGILVTGTSSVITSVLGNINIKATGNGTGATNTGLSVTSAGAISSTSGTIQTTAPHAKGGAGTTNCYGIFVDGTNSRITTISGSVNLTGIANGAGATNQGIRLSSAGSITSTTTGNITLTGTGSASGTSSSEGVFVTGSSTTVSATNGQIQITGTAGGGTVNGITVDSSGTVVTNTTGNIGISSLQRLVIQNNSTLRTLGVGGPGLNDINMTTNGITVAGGASGRGLISTVNGNIQAVSTDTVLLTGSSAVNSFAQITVGNVANTINLQTVGMALTGGSGSGAFAEISTIGGTLTLDGTLTTSGAITLTGGSNTNTYAQIITKTTARTTANDMILIGQILGNVHPTNITLLGGSGGTSSRAIIATDQGGNILCTSTGNHSITGGTGATDSRAGFYTGLTSGSGNITMAGSGCTLTGGASGAGINRAEISTPAPGGVISITVNNTPLILQGGSGAISDARIITQAAASPITISGVTTFSLTGGSGANSVAQIVTNAGGDLLFTIPGNYTITGGTGSANSRAGFYTGLTSGSGNITLTGNSYTLTGGASGTGTNRAEIAAAAGGGSISLTSNSGTTTLQGGGGSGASARIITSGVGTIGLITNGNVSLLGSNTVGGTNALASITTTNGNITGDIEGLLTLTSGSQTGTSTQITVGNAANTINLQTVGMALIGGSGSGAFAEISTIGGTLTLDGTLTTSGAITLTGGSNTNTYAQIITKTTARTTANDMILIGQISGNIHPTNITLLGGSGGTSSRAIIATDQGGNILCTSTGNHSITGGTGATDSRAGFYTGLTSGSGDITLSGTSYSLTGGASGTGYNSAEILAPLSGGVITITSNNNPVSLIAGESATSDARIESLASGNLNINTISSFTATGGSGVTTSRAIIATGQGGDINITGDDTYTITGGIGATDSRAGIYAGRTSGAGDIILSGTSYSLTGGASGSGYNSAEISADSGIINLTATSGSGTLQGGGAAISDARMITLSSGDINITGVSDFSLIGGSGTSSVADINAQGAVTSNINTSNYILTGGSGTSSVARFTATGALQLTGGDYMLAAGNSAIANGSDALIQSTGINGSVTLTANNTGVVTLNGGAASDQYSYIQTTALAGANPINLNCVALTLNGSTTLGATNASAHIQTGQGNINVIASGDITIVGGVDSMSEALINSTASGFITLNARNLVVQGGGVLGDAGILTQSGDISITCAQDCLYSAALITAPAIMKTLGSDLTVDAQNIRLVGSSILSTPHPGNLLLRAGVDIELGSGSRVHAQGNAGSSLTLIVDNNFPTSPGIGPGQFILHPGAFVLTNGLQASLKIYTATLPQNIINALLINGAPFVPGNQFVNSPIQQWQVYAPGGTYTTTVPFKFYYKNNGVPIIPSVITTASDAYFLSVMANQVQLAGLLPLLKAPARFHQFPGYHFQLCIQEDKRDCDPTFSPYGSFIFEDDVYWIENVN